MSLRRSSLLRSLSSTALLGLALASTTGCEPAMEAYMAEEVGMRSQQFGRTVGPWVPGKHRMRVALEDAGRDTLIQDEELSFSIQ